jgi:pilus assembly protein CpaB
MRAKTILSLLFVASLAFVGFLVYQAMPKAAITTAEAPPPVPKNEVLVTTAALAAGTLLRQEDVTWHAEAADLGDQVFKRPNQTLRQLKTTADDDARSEVFGAALRVALAAGAPIPRNGIVKPGDREFLRVVLSPGTRAVAIPVATGGAGTGLLFPGDRADVILTQNFKGDDTPLTRRSVSETVAENLRVVAIDSAAKGDGPMNAARMVTLEMLPEQAEKINVAAELGKLSLTLRSPNDVGQTADDTPGPGTSSGVKPTWAVDVSPALRSAVPPAKVIAAEKPDVKVMRGSKSEDVKPE